MRKPTSRRGVFVLLVILLAACLLVEDLRVYAVWQALVFASTLFNNACRTGGTWAYWALAGLSVAVIAEVVLWIRLRPRRSRWLSVLTGLTVVAATLAAVPAVTCPGPSTKWWDPTSQPPCWGQICPGHTSYDEVLETLRSRPDIALGSMRCYNYEGHRVVEWSFTIKDEGRGSCYFPLDGPVIAVELRVHGITLGDVVKRFGEPDLFEARGTGFEGGHRSVRLLYRRKGILVEGSDQLHWKPLDGKENLDSHMPADRIWFFDTEAPVEQLGARYLLGTDALDGFAGFRVWEGFGLVPYITGDRQ